MSTVGVLRPSSIVETRTITAVNSQQWFSTQAASDDTRRQPITFVKLNNLKDNPGAVKKFRRVGRGIGSSKGKTCGKGHKGQKSRSGFKLPHPLFEGGQTPLHKRLPKRGFKARKKPLLPINLGRIQDYIDMGRLPGAGNSFENPLTMRHMVEAGILADNTTQKHGGAKLLSDGKERFRDPLHIVIGRASREAIRVVEEAGGSVTMVHYNARSLRQVLRRPERVKRFYRQARPPPKYQPFYTNWNNRGYLHPAIQMRKWFLDAGKDFEEKFNNIRKEQQVEKEE